MLSFCALLCHRLVALLVTAVDRKRDGRGEGHKCRIFTACAWYNHGRLNHTCTLFMFLPLFDFMAVLFPELVIVGVGLCVYACVKYVAIYVFCKPALCPCAPPLAAQVSPEFSFPCVFCGDCG